jgi:hypothetical protein
MEKWYVYTAAVHKRRCIFYFGEFGGIRIQGLEWLGIYDFVFATLLDEAVVQVDEWRDFLYASS